jgi:hypothetical protein
VSSTERDRQFAQLYRDARVEDQRRYYEGKAAQNEAAHRQLLLVSSVLFGLSSTVALVAGIDMEGKKAWAILAAVLPALTTAVTAYAGLFSFERVAKLYRDAARNLRRVAPPGFDGGADAREAVVAYVDAIERIFEQERGQWGQLGRRQEQQQQERPQEPEPEQKKPEA